MNKVYVKLPNAIPGGREPLDKLKIMVDYQKGGINYFNGCVENRGAFVYVSPCTHSNGVEGCFINGDTHTMGVKFFIKPMGRNNAKQIEKIAAVVMPLAERIAVLYDARNYAAIHELIKGAVSPVI